MSETISGKIIDAGPEGLTIRAPYSDWQRFVLRRYEDVYETVYPLRRREQPSPHQTPAAGQRWKMVPLGAISAHRCPHPKSRRPMGVNQREDSPRNPIV